MLHLRLKNRTCILGMALICIGLAGCSVGKNSVLFVTKTSLGVDIDTKPQTFAVGYDRKEGTVAPVVEEGEVLPQMASFSTTSGFPFNAAIGQSFATGNSAFLFSKYLVSTARPKPTRSISSEEIRGKDFKLYSILISTDRKRYFFGTDTSWALKVGFAMEAGGVPDSISLGYKRKEVAYAPLIDSTDENGNARLYLPSLLATAGMSSNVAGQTADVAFSQFFATGQAANNLAALPEVRLTVGKFLVPEATEQIDAVKKELNVARNAEFYSAARTAKQEKLFSDIDKLPLEAAEHLLHNPPIPDSGIVTGVLENVDAKCIRFVNRTCPPAAVNTNTYDVNEARRLSKIRINMGAETMEQMSIWERTINGLLQ